MKLVINASNLVSSGGLQVGRSFIYECLKYPNNEYFVWMCPRLSQQVETTAFPSNFHFLNVEAIPAILGKGRSVLNMLRKKEREIKPDCVFTVFGPTYWTPQAPHCMGFAMPHYVYEDSPFFKLISWKENWEWKLRGLVKMFFLKRNARFFHTETNDVRQRLAIRLRISANNIFTVQNTFSSVYDSFVANESKTNVLPPAPNSFRLVCISGYYRHKNLEILNAVVPILSDLGHNDIRFVLTLPDNVFRKIFTKETQEKIDNIGPINVDDCPQIYKEVDAVFLPTLLECFSANYPEAMKMEKPLLTSDLSFARDVCERAALYFNPLDAADVAAKIIQLKEDVNVRKELVQLGKLRVNDFHSAAQRAAQYLAICREIIAK